MELNQPLVSVPLVLVCLIFFIQSPPALCCHEQERISLLTVKSFLADPSNRLSSWQGRNCCNWHGIHCSRDSLQVVSIDLRNPNPETFLRNFDSAVVSTSSQSLTTRSGTLSAIISTSSQPPNSTALVGSVSPLLFNLVFLEYLDLSYNNLNFSNTSANQFSKLRNLTYLDLSHSMLSGSITAQFTNLSSLRYLDISCSSSIVDYSTYSYNFNTSKVSYKYDSSYFSTSYISSTSLNWLNGLVNLEVLRLTGVDLSMASSAMNWAEPLSFFYNLRELDLSDCRIPSQVFPVREFLNLSRLASLRMSSNNFNSPIPAQFTNLTSLSVLDLANCNLQGSITHLPQLKELYVGVNPYLNVNLAWFFNQHWPKLQVLSMHLTKVEGTIPSSISNASSLVSLDMLGCAIQGPLPASISNLSQLQKLELDHNNIAGSIPPSISKLKQLQILSLVQNNLQGFIPESVCEMSSLQQINLGRNNLTGTVPRCINKLTNLQKFFIGGNSIGGTISLNSLIDKSNLTWISLKMNKLTVEVDENLGLTKFGLQALDLQSCNLKGPILAFVCGLPQLVALDLSRNNLQGAIPSCIFELQNLSYLDLSRNNLQGTIPHSVNLTLQFAFPTLNLANNKLRGRLPLPPQHVGVFDLSHNEFTGAISNDIGRRLCSIEYVSLSDNKLSGSIPSSMCPHRNNSMMHLDLSNNELTDTIPSSLQYCDSLISLNLGMNNLTGNIPHELERLKNLKTLLLNDNALNGAFPTFIQQLRELEVLNIGNNKFGGSIPDSIGTLRNLKIFVLRSNEFNGTIPPEITRLHKLQILDMSKNKISGRVPSKIGNLEMLTRRPSNRILLGDEISFMLLDLRSTF